MFVQRKGIRYGEAEDYPIYPIGSVLIIGTVNRNQWTNEMGEWALGSKPADRSGPWTLVHEGDHKLYPFGGWLQSHYFATTTRYRFKPDGTAEPISENRDTGCNIPTPALVMLLRYFFDRTPVARVLYAGIEINVAPGVLLPLDTPRNFGWEEFKKAQEAFERPDWPYSTGTVPPTLQELRQLPRTIATLNSS